MQIVKQMAAGLIMSSKMLTGTVNITGYTPYTDDIFADDVLFDIYASSTLALFGDDQFQSGSVALEGQLRNRGVLDIDDGLTLLNSATFVNSNVVTQNGGNLLVGHGDYYATVTVRNIKGATWSLASDAGITGGISSQFVNLGLLEESGALSTIDDNFYDRGGQIQVNGNLDFDDGDIFYSLTDRFINDVIEGPGVVELNGGVEEVHPLSVGIVELDDVLVGTKISTDTTDLTRVRTIDNVIVSSPTVDIDRLNLGAGSVLSLTNSNAQIRGLGSIRGVGQIDIRGNDTVSFSDADFRGGMTLASFGNTTFSAVHLNVTPWAGDQLTVENEVGATWTDVNGDDSVFVQNASAGSGMFVNNGLFVENTLHGVTFYMDVNNNGSIEAGSNSTPGGDNFTFYDPVTGSGNIEIGVNEVAFKNLVGDGQTLHFNPAPSDDGAPTLLLDNPATFAGLITGFDQNGAQGDQLVVDMPAWQYVNFVANSNGTGGSLMFVNGSAEAAVSLAGSFDPNGFHALVSGGQTTITYAG